MSLLLGAAWALAADLGIDPDTVLDWRGSKVAMWTVVAGRHRRAELLQYMVALSHAVWSPKDLANLLSESKAASRARAPVDARAAVERADRISRMRTREVTLEELKELRNRGKDGRS